MALSYRRLDPAMMQERAPRTSQPSHRAREAANGRPQAAKPTRRVQFNLQPAVTPAVVAPVTLRPADPLTSNSAVMAPATLRLADPLILDLGTATYHVKTIGTVLGALTSGPNISGRSRSVGEVRLPGTPTSILSTWFAPLQLGARGNKPTIPSFQLVP